MSGARKRRGTTLVELSLVIAILAMVALPFAAFVSQNLKNTVQSSTQLKEQMVLEQVMQDMEKHLRSAIRVKSDGTSCPITFPTGGISFTSSDPQKVVSTRSVQTQYTYVLASGLLTRTVGMNSGVTFPDGLEASLITKLKFWSTTTEPPDAATPEPPDAATPPCYLTVRMEAYNPTLQTTTALQETIYLRNYTLIVDIAKILGVTAPVPGATPTPAIAATSEYTATISWSGSPVTFAAGTPYTATITLTPRGDYTLTGVAAKFFTVAGATTVTNPVNSGVVTAVFPAIGATQLTIAAPTLMLLKPYDGNTTAAVTAGALSGVVSPDVVTVTAVATYDTAAVGTSKTITVVYILGGADAGNYVKPENYTATGTITAKAITVTATGPSKAYGTALTAGTSATNFTASGAIAGETVTSVILTPDAAGLSATTAAGAAYVVTPSLATGTGGFLASNYLVTCVAYSGTVAAAPITAIGAITGTPQVGQTLTAGTVTPSGATATYRWQSATTSGGTYADITGATGTTYTLVAGDLGKYIKVVATGTGNYTGTVTSAATGVITPLVQINIAAIPGVTVPVAGATPVTAITATTQYTGTVTWLPLGTTFAGKTVYTATITLTPKAGYTLTGVAANFFTVDGTHGGGATNNAGSGVVTAIFPQTGNWP